MRPAPGRLARSFLLFLASLRASLLLSFESNLAKALQLAVMSDRVDIVRLILEGPAGGYRMEARINSRSHGGRGDTLLQGAVMQGFESMAGVLLAHGADLSLLTHDHLSLVQ